HSGQQLRRCQMRLDIVQGRYHCLAGLVAGIMAAHPVRHRPQALFWPVKAGILIEFAYHADIGAGRAFETELDARAHRRPRTASDLADIAEALPLAPAPSQPASVEEGRKSIRIRHAAN